MVRLLGRAVRVMVMITIITLTSTVTADTKTYVMVSQEIFYIDMCYMFKYLPVAPSFPPDLSISFLVEMKERQCKQSHPCLHQCNLQPTCRLVCVKDSTCHMYRRWVGEQWSGYNNTDALHFGSCFTSWTNQRRIFPVATNQSGNFMDYYSSEAVSGYLTSSVRFCSITARVDNPWWWADLGESKTVSQIVVHIRRDGHSDSQFRSVIARLGDSLDAFQNPVFDSKNGVPIIGSIEKFSPARPKKGRYLSLQSIVSAGYLTLCNVQILS
ncbi:uncharacterized protein LOC119588242 [Penaeus monodon]|uniref:uncharacterized protein LOC119588242 n=1 Tax=Penaeus monodon TaxID=6687 RepID=UPI0018A75D41|nr:uncharacterized protein LOC119588242 [Penaeus monodon]